MSKNVLNQRYCYKLNSDYIRRSKDNVIIKDIKAAIKNRLIVGIGDSTGTRMIRDIVKSKYNEEYINNIKMEIKLEVKEGKNSKKLIKLNEELLKSSLQSELCNVVFKNDKDYDRYTKNGFMLNGKRYVILLGSSGGIKQNTVLFIREDLKDKMNDKINNGADLSIPMIPSKLMAYKALTFSSSTPVTFTRNILVVEDVETSFKSDVVYINFDDDKDEPTVENIKDYKVVNNACDGCGLITPRLAEQWGIDLQLEYTPTSFVIRNAWMKGVLTNFDFVAYANSREDMKGKKVKDVWGKEWDLEDVDIIMNRSMFKLSKHYKSLDNFLMNCENNGYEFAVTKYVHKEIDNERALNYQYIQCLNLKDIDIDNLLEKDINEIKDVLGTDYIKSILFGRGKDLNDKNVWRPDNIESQHISALMINKDCINDSYIRDKIRRAIQKRIDLLKTGKINVNGNYQVAIGEPVIQMENMFGLEPKGLLQANEFFIEYWRKLGKDKVAGFRSPMSCKQNARVMNVCNREEVIKWYGHLNNVIVFNAWDTSMSAFNGEDFDGDLNFTSDNEILINGIYDLPTIFCEGKSADKISNPTEDHFIKAIHDGFGNKVGSVTNFGSSCYDVMSLFEEGSKEYEELDYRIMCIQYLQQECIDSAKNGIPPKPIPSYWNNYQSEKLKIKVDKETGEILNTKEELEEIEFYNRILTEKKPYYFRYIYKESQNEYLKYINSMKVNCMRNFNKSLEELLSSTERNQTEEDFINHYKKHMPLSDNPCVVNKIAHKVEDVFDEQSKTSKIKDEFDYTVYMTQNEFKATSKQKKAIVDLYEEYKKITGNQKSTITRELSKDESKKENKEMFEILRCQMREIIPCEADLTNVLIEMSYKSTKISKFFVWGMFGETILNNLLKNSGSNVIKYPTRDEEGDIAYNGDRFKLVSKVLEGEV